MQMLSQKSLPSYLLPCKVTLLLFSSKVEVCFLSPWIWNDLVTCFDQWNVIEVSLCDFPGSGLKQTLQLLFFVLLECWDQNAMKSSASLLGRKKTTWRRTKVPHETQHQLLEPSRHRGPSDWLPNSLSAIYYCIMTTNTQWLKITHFVFLS